jgi:hypothetical protein
VDNEREEVELWLATARWQFAKTMPTTPHEYTLRKWNDDDLFDKAVAFIRANGYVDVFGGRKYTYYDYAGHQYWTMGSPIAATILINRALLPEDDPSDYLEDLPF